MAGTNDDDDDVTDDQTLNGYIPQTQMDNVQVEIAPNKLDDPENIADITNHHLQSAATSHLYNHQKYFKQYKVCLKMIKD